MPISIKKRSTVLIAVGAGTLVCVTGLAAFAMNDSDGGKDAAPPAAVTTTTVADPDGAVAAPGEVVAAQPFVIPSGKQAMALEVPVVHGLSGYAKAGDFVNVYTTVGQPKSYPTDGTAPQHAKLILQKVEVLATNPPAAGQTTITFVLAVNTRDAEAIGYLDSFQNIYLTLARDDQGTQSPQGFTTADA